MTVNEFLRATGMPLARLSHGADVSYTHLHGHARHGRKIGDVVAGKLETWTRAEVAAGRLRAGQWICATEVLGYASDEPLPTGQVAS